MPNRAIRLLVALLVVVGAGYFIVRSLVPVDGATLLREAQTTADAAADALAQSNASGAQAQIDRLGPLLERAIKAYEKAVARKNAQEKLPELRVWRAELCYLRARYLRDRAFARAAVAGKPLPDTLDTTLGTGFRNYLNIPDANERRDAVVFLRQAAEGLSDNETVLTDALRTELTLSPMSWTEVHRLTQALLKVKPDDARALYLLARYQFEQPPADAPSQVTPPEKRSAERVAAALTQLQLLKATKNYPIWRTFYLEAQIQQWLLRDARAHKDEPAARDARAALERVLFDEHGALARAAAAEGLTGVSYWDRDGAAGVFQIALEVRLADAQSARASHADKIAQVVRALVDFGVACRTAKHELLTADFLTTQAMTALVRTQPVLTRDAPAEWTALLDHTRSLLRPAMLEGQIAPATCAHFANFLLLESRQEETRGGTAQATKRSAEAAAWLQDGLRVAADRKLTAARQVPLHAASAYLKLRTGAARDAVAAHLTALANLPDPDAKASLSLLEALVALREGRLEKSYESIDQSHGLFTPEQSTRSDVLLTQVYLGLGNVDRLLPVLRRLESAFESWDQLAVLDRLWLLDFVPRREQLAYIVAQTQLDIARDRHTRFTQRQPGRAVPADLIQQQEREVEKLARSMPADSPSLTYLRQSQVVFYHAINQPAQADAAVAALRQSPTTRCAALASSLWRAEQAGRTPALTDLEQELRAALQKNPRDDDARLMLAVLLARTERTAEATALLAKASFAAPAGNYLFPEQLDALGSLYAGAGRSDLWPQMRQVFTAALERHPHDPRFQLRLGQSLIVQGDTDAAIPALHRALNLAQCRLTRFTPAQRQELVRIVEAALEPPQ